METPSHETSEIALLRRHRSEDDDDDNNISTLYSSGEPVVQVPSFRVDLPAIRVRELDLSLIRPNNESVGTELGGSKITVIGKPGSGKSILIKALLHSKRHLIPAGAVISGSEDSNRFYAALFPKIFIHEKYHRDIVDSFIRRQKLARTRLSNPWSVLVMDDCMDDVRIFNDPLMIGLFKNSRHWNMLSIFANQYVFDFKPVIRTNIDGVFIFREPNLSNREKMYKNFASIIPSFKIFSQLMDEMTDNFSCIYIHNQTTSNDWLDCVYYYRAPMLDNFKFGCEDYWRFAYVRQQEETEEDEVGALGGPPPTS